MEWNDAFSDEDRERAIRSRGNDGKSTRSVDIKSQAIRWGFAGDQDGTASRGMWTSRNRSRREYNIESRIQSNNSDSDRDRDRRQKERQDQL